MLNIALNLGILVITFKCGRDEECKYQLGNQFETWNTNIMTRFYICFNMILILIYFLPFLLYFWYTIRSLRILKQIDSKLYKESRWIMVILATAFILVFILQRNILFILVKYTHIVQRYNFNFFLIMEPICESILVTFLITFQVSEYYSEFKVEDDLSVKRNMLNRER